MSFSATSRYMLEAEARRLANMNRVRATTDSFLQRYRAMLKDFIHDRLDRYIPDEMNTLKNDLSAAESRLVSDPFSARTISQEIGTYIHTMRRLSHEHQVQQEFAEKERLRVEAEERAAVKTAAMSAYYAAVRKISGAAVQNFAKEGLAVIRKAVESGSLSSEASIEKRVAEVKSAAEAKAFEWQKQPAERVQRESLNDQIQETKDRISSEQMDAADKKKVLASLDALLNRTHSASSVAEIQESIQEIDKEAEEKIVSEEERKVVVRAVVKILRGQGFDVLPSNVTLISKDGHDNVMIVANKANGRHAEIEITDNGMLHKKFERYEGKSCMKDLRSLDADLDKIYSIKQSDERVLWENPDRIGQDADDLPNFNTNRRA